MRRAFSSLPVVILSLSAMVTLQGCMGPRYVISGPLDSAETLSPAVGITRNVVLVSIDGLRPDAIARFDAPTLQRLIREGGSSLSARTIHAQQDAAVAHLDAERRAA